MKTFREYLAEAKVEKGELNESSLFYKDIKLFGKIINYNGEIYECIEANRTPDDLLMVLQSGQKFKSFLNPNLTNMIICKDLKDAFKGHTYEENLLKKGEVQEISWADNIKVESEYFFFPHNGLKFDNEKQLDVKDIMGTSLEQIKNIAKFFGYKKVKFEAIELTGVKVSGRKSAKYYGISIN